MMTHSLICLLWRPKQQSRPRHVFSYLFLFIHFIFTFIVVMFMPSWAVFVLLSRETEYQITNWAKCTTNDIADFENRCKGWIHECVVTLCTENYAECVQSGKIHRKHSTKYTEVHNASKSTHCKIGDECFNQWMWEISESADGFGN